MIGEYTVRNVLVTEKLIKDTKARVNKLKKEEIEWNDTIGELLRED